MVTAQELLTGQYQGQSSMYEESPAQKIITTQKLQQQALQDLLSGKTSYQILQEKGILPPSDYQLGQITKVPTPPWRGTTFQQGPSFQIGEAPTVEVPKFSDSTFYQYLADIYKEPIRQTTTISPPIISEFVKDKEKLETGPFGVPAQILPEWLKRESSVKELYTGAKAAAREYVPPSLEFGPFGIPGQLLSDKTKAIVPTRKEYIRTPVLFGIGAAETLTPSTAGEAAATAALINYWSKIPSVIQAGLGAASVFKGGTTLASAQTPEEFGAGTAEVGLGTVILAPKIKSTYDFFTSRPAGTVPSPSVIEGKQFTRQRASAIIKDKDGKILLEKSADSGREILPGGDIKKTETPLQAIKREIKEELLGSKELASKTSDAQFKKKTGIDLSKLKKIDEVQAIPEENQIVFELKTDTINLNKLKAQAGEVERFTLRDPVEAPKTVSEILGGKKTSWIGGDKVRGQDAFSIARAENLERIRSSLKDINPKQREAIVKLARDWAEQRYGTKAASKLEGNRLIEDYLLFTQGLEVRTAYAFPAQETFMRGGQIQFLKTRVPAAAERSLWQKITRKKPGTFAKFQKEPRIALGLTSRYDVPGEIALQYEGGKQIFVRGGPELMRTTTGAKARKGSEFEVLEKYFKRGEKVLFFQPPRTPGGEPFVATNYLGIGGRETPEAGFTFFGKSPVIQYTKTRVGQGGDLIFTKKALAGKELEVGTLPGTVFKITGEPKSTRILGKKVRVQEIEAVKPVSRQLTQAEIDAGFAKRAGKPKELAEFQRKVLEQTGVEYETGYVPVVVSERVPFLPGKGKGGEREETVNIEKIEAPKLFSIGKEEGPTKPKEEGLPFIPRESGKPYPGELGKPSPGEPSGFIPEEPPPTTPKKTKYTTEKPEYVKETPGKYKYVSSKEPPRGPPGTPPTIPPKLRGIYKKTKPKSKGEELFVPFVRRFGKFKPVSRPVSLRIATQKGLGRVRRTLGASLQIRKARTGEAVMLKAPRGFRYGKREPTVLVQKKVTPFGGRLTSPSERREIVASRRVSWLRA